MKLTKMTGAITKSIVRAKNIGVSLDAQLINDLLLNTNNLINVFLGNTNIFNAFIKPEYVNVPHLYTIFNRRDSNNIPYSVSDLSSDLVNGIVSRKVIDETTEESILNISKNLSAVDFESSPTVIIESNCGKYYLILEGNKRTVGMHLAQHTNSLPTTKIYIGKTSLSWTEMLAEFGMKEKCNKK